jgi:hypothetical protein
MALASIPSGARRRASAFGFDPRNEGPDALLSLDEKSERRRLDPPNGEELAVGQSGSAGEVHSDEPVGSGPAVGRIGEGIELGSWAKSS